MICGASAIEMRVISVIILYWGVASAHGSSENKQFRSDYEYNRKTDAFYKLHIETMSHTNAQRICKAEGARLMLVTSKEDLSQAHGMMKQFPDMTSTVWVANDGQNHDSAELEKAIIDLSTTDSDDLTLNSVECDMLTRDLEVETMACYKSLPFLCKADAKDITYDERCGVYDKDYRYVENVHSCYKVPNVAMTWDQAYSDCRKTGAHLAILNSEAEHEAVKDLLRTAPKLVDIAKTSYFYLVGIRANRPTDNTARVFRTIFNETLQEAGYDVWSPGEPNNFRDSEYCGSIFANTGKYNDVDCTHPYGFICEKEVPANANT